MQIEDCKSLTWCQVNTHFVTQQHICFPLFFFFRAKEIEHHFALTPRNGYSVCLLCILHKERNAVFSLCEYALVLISLLEYTITMYDTKSRELRWNATYSDYASTLPDDDTKYSKTLRNANLFVCLVSDQNQP